MKRDEEPRSHLPQGPDGSSRGKGNMTVKNEESSEERVELMLALKMSKPKKSIEVSSCLCEENEGCIGDDEHEDDSDNNYGLGTVYAKVEASQKDIQRGEDKAQTQMPSTKPKARTPVACRQLIDGNEAASLRDRSSLQVLALMETVTSGSNGSKRTSSVLESTTGKASVSAKQDEAPRLNPRTSNITREENKSKYYKELCLQVEERKQQKERERRRNTIDEQKHNETMQHSVWGMPGSGAPNYHRGTMKRTNSLYSAGILPQEQIRDKGFSGTPFHCP